MNENVNIDEWVIVRKYPDPHVELMPPEKVNHDEFCFWRVNEATNRTEYVRKEQLEFWQLNG